MREVLDRVHSRRPYQHLLVKLDKMQHAVSEELFWQLGQSSLHQKLLQFVVEPSGQFELHLREKHCNFKVKLTICACLVGIGDLIQKKREGGFQLSDVRFLRKGLLASLFNHHFH